MVTYLVKHILNRAQEAGFKSLIPTYRGKMSQLVKQGFRCLCLSLSTSLLLSIPLYPIISIYIRLPIIYIYKYMYVYIYEHTLDW